MRIKARFTLAACLALAAGPVFAQSMRMVSVGSAANYTTGTVSITSGSPVVIGSGTLWLTANRGPGDSIAIGATGYMIDSITSETRIVVRSLAGSTQSGAAYTIMRKFATLAAWGAQSRDLITANQAEVAMLYKDAELMAANITGWSTDPAHTMTIKAAPGNRHIGKANTGVVVNGNVASWNISIPHTKLEGLEIRNLGSNGLNLSASNCKVSGCLIRDGNTDAKAVYLNGATNDTVFNCIIYGHKYGVGGTGSGNFTFINNTVALCDTGWGILSGIITRVNNNIFWGNKLKDVADDGTTAIDNDDMYNICGDNSLSAVPGNLCVDFAQIGFIDTATATRDLHILGFSAARDQGVSFAGLFNRDVDDSLRPQGPAWDIGADEYYGFQYLALANHVAGQKPNAFGANGGETGAGLCAFQLYPGSGTPLVTQLVISLSNVSGITTGDMTSAALYIDANSNGIIDAGEATTVGGAGGVNITGTTGTITFSSSFNVSAPTNYILRANVANLVANDSLMVGLVNSDITTAYATMGMVQPAKHKEMNPAGVVWDGGGADGSWNTGMNWSTDAMPTSGDSVIFKSTSVKSCSLSSNVTVKAITFTSGYTGTFYFKGFNLTLNGEGDFRSGGTLNMLGTDTVKFQAGAGMKKLIPPAGSLFPAIYIPAACSIRVMYNGFKTNKLTVLGYLDLGVNTRDSVGTDLMLSSGFINFGTLCTLQTSAAANGLTALMGMNPNTGYLSFTGTIAQNFTPKMNVRHPNIIINKASNSVTVQTNALKAGTLIIKSGVINLGTTSADTVDAIISMGNMGTLDFNTNGLSVTGNADLGGLSAVNAGTGMLKFIGPAPQIFTPKAGATHPNITVQKDSIASVTLAANNLLAGSIQINSGVFALGAGLTHQVTSIMGNSGATVDFGSSTLQSTGTTDFNNINVVAGTGTLEFSGSGAQTFTPRANTLFPNIAKSNTGSVICNTRGFKAKNLTISSGSFETGAYSDTVENVSGSGSLIITTAGGALNITGSSADFSNFTSVSASGPVRFIGGSAQTFIPKAGYVYPELFQNGAGGTTVQTNGFKTGTFTVANGDFNLGTGLTDSAGTIAGSGGGTLNFGSSTLQTGATTVDLSGFSAITAGTGTLEFTASGAQALIPKASATHPSIVHSGVGALTLSVNDLTANSFANSAGQLNFGGMDITTVGGGSFTITNGTTSTISGLDGVTITVAGNASFAGQNANLLNLNPTSTWYINATGTLTADYATIGHSDASGSASRGTVTNSTNSGYNVNWGTVTNVTSPLGSITSYPSPNQISGTYQGSPSDIEIAVYNGSFYWTGTDFSSGTENWMSAGTYGSFSAGTWNMTSSVPAWNSLVNYTIKTRGIEGGFIEDTVNVDYFDYTGPTANLSTPSGAISTYPNPNKLTGIYTGTPTDIQVSIYCMDSTNYWNGTSFGGPETFFSLTTSGSFSANSWEMTSNLPTWSNCQYYIKVVAVDGGFGDTNSSGNFTYSGPSAALSTPSGPISMYPSPNKLSGSYSGFPTDIQVSIYCMDSTNYWNGTSFGGPETFFSLTTSGSFSANLWEMTSNLPTWSNCQYYIKVVAVDGPFGDTNSSGSFTYTGPTASLSTPSGAISMYPNPDKLTGSYTGFPTDIKVSIYCMDSANYWNGTSFSGPETYFSLGTFGSFSANAWEMTSGLPTWSNCQYYIKVVAVDQEFGDTNNSGNFTYTGPTASLTSPSGAISTYPSPNQLNGSYTGNPTDIKISIYCMDSANYWNGTSFSGPETFFSLGTYGSFSASIWDMTSGLPTWSNGQYNIKVVAVDQAFGDTNTSGSFTYTGPTATVTGPTGNVSSVSQLQGAYTGTPTNIEFQVYNGTNYWDGGSWTAGPTWLTLNPTYGTFSANTWQATTSLPTWTNGTYTINCRAVDGGYTETAGAGSNFTLDNSAPTSSVTTPVNAGWIQSVPTIDGSASDAGSGLQLVEIRIMRSDSKYWSGSIWDTPETWFSASGTTSWSYNATGVGFATGYTYTIVSRAKDNANNTETPGAGNTFTFDNVAPTTAITVPAAAGAYNTLATISGTANDPHSGLSQVQLCIKRNSDNYYWDGASAFGASQVWLAATGTASWSYNSSGVAWTSGGYTVITRAQDNATNQETPGAGNTFTFDNTAPASTVSAPANSATLAVLASITGTANDGAGSGVSSIEISIQENPPTGNYWGGSAFDQVSEFWLAATGTTSWSYNSGSVGWTSGNTYKVRSNAIDAAANETANTGNTFTFDNTAPVSSVTSPAGSSFQNAVSSISGTASDNVAVSQVHITIQRVGDSQYWTGAGWGSQTWLSVTGTTSWSYNASGVSWTAGTFTVVSRAQDNAANQETPGAGNTFTFDNTAPTVDIQNEPAYKNNLTAFNVTFEFSEDVSGFVAGDITVGNGTAGNFVAVDGNTYTADITPTGAGNITIDVAVSVCTDLAANNNAAATQASIIYDASAPTVVITTASESPTNVSPFGITVTFNEDVSSFVVGNISVGNGTAGNFANTTPNRIWTADITPASDGPVTVDVNASVTTDLAGNTNTGATQVSVTYDNTKPSVSSAAITSPNGGEVWQTNTSNNITWNTGVISDAMLKANPITLEFSNNGGSSWLTIASNEANDGVCAWTPSLNHPAVWVRIAVTDSAGNVAYDTCDATFIVDNAAPSVPSNALTAPNNGEVWQAGTSHSITWSNGSISDFALKANPITLEYTINGSTWNNIASNEANDGTYAWTVASLNSATVRVRIGVTDSIGLTSYDTSDAMFYVDNAAPTVSSATLTAPNGSENWAGGTSHNITWNSGSISDILLKATPVTLKYSTDGGATFANTIVSNIANSGTYNWTVPSIDNNQVRVQICVTDSVGNVSYDTSDANFVLDNSAPVVGSGTVTSPNGGEKWLAGSSHPITWNTGTITDALLKAAPITLQYSTDNGATFPNTIVSNIANSGAYNWTLPVITSNTVRVRIMVTDSAANSSYDTSNAVFKIDGTVPVLVVTSPTSNSVWNGLPPVTGTASDSGTGLAQVQVNLTRESDTLSWNGSSWSAGVNWVTASGLGSWVAGQPAIWTTGYYIVKARAIDSTGNMYTMPAGIRMLADSTKPASIITVPASGALLSVLDTVKGTASDAHSGVHSTKIRLLNKTDSTFWTGASWGVTEQWITTFGTTAWTYAYLPVWTNGVYEITARAWDSAGNAEAIGAARQFRMDVAAPTVVVSSGISGVTNVNPIPVTITFSEPVIGMNVSKITVGNGTAGGLVNTNATTWTANITPIADGLVTVIVAAGAVTDSAGSSNMASTQFSVTYDGTAPTGGSITIASNGGFTNDSTPTLTLAATGADSMRFKVDSLAATAYEAYGTSKNTLNISANGQGLRTVAVMYKDRAGNATGWIAAAVTLDVTPPSGAAVAVTSSRLTNNSLINLSLVATGADSMRLKVNTGSWGVWEGFNTAKTGYSVGTADGAKRIYAEFKDKAGNLSAQVSDTMTLDATPPINSAVLDASVTPLAKVRLYWGSVAINPADVESVAVWYRTDRYPTAANDSGAVLVSRGTTAKTVDTLQAPALNQKYYFGLFLRDAAGNWSTLGAAARDTANVSYPVISTAGDTNAYEDSLYTLDVNAVDAGNDPVTFALLIAPSGMSIVAATGVVSWRPATSQIGDTVVSILASDGVLFDTLTYALHVHMVNRAPVFVTTAADLPDTVFEYQAWQYAVHASDADSAKGDSAWYFLSVHPAGMTIDAATGTLSWSVDSSMVGWSGSAQIIAFDTRGGSDTLNFTIAAGNVNDAPVILTTATIDTVLEDSPYSRSMAVYDKDAGDVLRWQKVIAPPAMSIDSVSGSISWTPVNSDVSSKVVSVRVVDAGGLADTLQFMVRVLNTNDAPVISTVVVRDTAAEDSIYQRRLAAMDVDLGDSLVLRWKKIGAPQGLSIDSITGMVSWTPANSQVGDTLVRVMVRDPAGASDTLAYTISVANRNDAPVFVTVAGDTVVTFEDTLYQITVVATDQDALDSLRYAKIQGPAGAVMIGNRLSWTPTNSDVGIHTIGIRVMDKANAADTLSFVLLVRNANDAPVFSLLEEPYVYYGALKVKFRVSDADRLNGFDDTLAYQFGVCRLRTHTDTVLYTGNALVKDSLLVGEIFPLYDDTLILFGTASDGVAHGMFKDTIIIGANGQSVVKQTFTSGAWHMMSVPTTDLARVVGAADSAKRFYRWDPRGNVYAEPSDTAAWDAAGTGFWMLADAAVPVNVASTDRLPGGIACSVRVIEGWNQISSPYPYAVMFSPAYADTLWTWSNGQYISNNVLEPWKSYFYHAPGTGHIVFDGQPYNPDQNQAAARALAKPLYVDGTDWRMRISAIGSFSADRNNYAGVNSAAKASIDGLDQFEPPASPMGGVSVWFEAVGDSVNRLSRDLKSAQSNTNWWVVAVDPSADKGTITLSFEGLPQSMYAYLGDKGQFTDLNKTSEVKISAEGKKYYSLVVTDDPDFAANLVTQYDLAQNWPNPFNPATNLAFSVPVNFSSQGRPVFDKQHVTLKIFDLGGRLVRTVTDGAYLPGRKYVKTWNGKANNGRLVASGMYVYQVEIGSASGGFVKSRKMVVVK